MLQLSIRPFDLTFREPFRVAGNARTHTEALFIQVEGEGARGYGQASFPPYLAPRREENLRWLRQWAAKGPLEESALAELLAEPVDVRLGLNPARAALDMALMDWSGKVRDQGLRAMCALPECADTPMLFTIGLGDRDFTDRKIREAASFSLIKLKLDDDAAQTADRIRFIRHRTEQALCADFNQAFQDREKAIRVLERLERQGFVFIEQPLAVEQDEDNRWLRERFALPLFADESIRDMEELQRKAACFDGVNVKLMKCGGIRNALELQREAVRLGLKTLLGCMAESVLATAAAALIAPEFDFADLDGHVAISNDPFRSWPIDQGKAILPQGAGLGIELVQPAVGESALFERIAV